MSQYISRIYIKVKCSSTWSRFKDVAINEIHLEELEKINRASFTIDGSYSEGELEDVVERISQKLGTDGIVIADTTNVNIDTYEYCVYYLGEGVKIDFFEGDHKKYNMFFETDIANVPEWLNYGKFSLSKREQEQLFQCGIVSYSKGSRIVYEAVPEIVEIKNQILLRHTSEEKRIAVIETLETLDKVELACTKGTKEEPRVIEVLCKGEVIGCLPSDEGDVLYPFLASNHLQYQAYITHIVPLSKRNKHASSPIVEIRIDAIKTNIEGR